MPVLVRQMREHDEEEEDIFDSSVNLEGSHLQQGFEDGFRDGVVAGKDEGREAAAIEKDGNAFTARAQRNVHQYHEQLLAYMLLSPLDERIQDLVDSTCGKFRAIMSMLSIHFDYEGYPKPNLAEDASF
ncbi:hypothetical protein BDL97_05G037300 [Sphagnum fallax]|nr:hypothetical protein BDL97_05G037300 [Sphagnum fallax]